MARPNRFIAHVLLDGKPEIAHVKNTGRCRELLLPGARVVLVRHPLNTGRKTDFSLIAVWKGDRLFNIDSQAPNQVWHEALLRGIPGLPTFQHIRREVFFGESRLDFFAQAGGEPAYMEIKGVTLEENGVAMFPDAPTARGQKHLRALTRARKKGMLAYAIFIIQTKGVTRFTPNAVTDPAFSAALRDAAHAGVQTLAFDCRTSPDTLDLGEPVPVDL